MLQERIERKLADALDPEHLEVVNESGNHNVADGSETHFKVVVVAQAFEGERLLKRHRLVNSTLGRGTRRRRACARYAHLHGGGMARRGSVPHRCRRLAWAATGVFRRGPIDDSGRLVSTSSTLLATSTAVRTSVDEACTAEGLKGTVLLAPEGVNAALAGPRPGIERVVAAHFPEADVKWSTAAADKPVFDRLKVRLKPEIVTFGLELSPATPVGVHVDAATWDRLLSDPSVTVLDVRNGYESDIGTFRGAKCANTATFGEFRDFVDT